MKIHQAPQAKIVNHSEGLGVPTADIIQQRAAEIARIDGRNTFNERDWQQAKIELHGGNSTDELDGVEEMLESVSERDMVAGSLGHHTENTGLEDAGNTVEELVAEGMDEAVHDQMLQSRKFEDRRDGA